MDCGPLHSQTSWNYCKNTNNVFLHICITYSLDYIPADIFSTSSLPPSHLPPSHPRSLPPSRPRSLPHSFSFSLPKYSQFLFIVCFSVFIVTCLRFNRLFLDKITYVKDNTTNERDVMFGDLFDQTRLLQ